MKTLKFHPKLMESILDGSKTITWRLFDDKDLRSGDHLEFISSETNEKFVQAEIVEVEEKQANRLTDDDLHAYGYRDRDHFFEINRKYYGDGVMENTLVKIIEFKIRET